MHGSAQPAKLSYQSRVIKQCHQTVKQPLPPRDHNHLRAEVERETPAGGRSDGPAQTSVISFSISVQII